MDPYALALFIFVCILLVAVLGAQYVHVHKIKYASEGSIALLLGSATAGTICLIYFAAYKQPLPGHWIRFDDTLIFQVLLPPIIFYAGFSLKKKLFFSNFATILTFGFGGTLFTAALVSMLASAGMQLVGLGHHPRPATALAIGTICSCSDTVGILQVVDRRRYPVLYSLVFGEGIMNDAVAIVLLGAVTAMKTQHRQGRAGRGGSGDGGGAAARPPLLRAAAGAAAPPSAAATWDPLRAPAAAPLLLPAPGAAAPAGGGALFRGGGAAAPAGGEGRARGASGDGAVVGGGGGDDDDDKPVTLASVVQLLGEFLWLGASSAALGAAMGLGSALIVRHAFSRSSHDCDREVLLLGLMGFLAYFAAGAMELSAVLAVFFSGLTMSHYTWHSMSPAGRSLSLHSFRVVSGLMELVLYAYSGVDMWSIVLAQQDKGWWWAAGRAAALALVLMVAIVVARVCFVLPASAAANVLWRRLGALSPADMGVISWAGLSRGAITLALAYHYFSAVDGGPSGDEQVILLALVLLVLISTTLLGVFTGPIVEFMLAEPKAPGRRHDRDQQQRQQQGLHERLEPDSDPLLPQEEPGAGDSSGGEDAAAAAAEEGRGLPSDDQCGVLRGLLSAASASMMLRAPLLEGDPSSPSSVGAAPDPAAASRPCPADVPPFPGAHDAPGGAGGGAPDGGGQQPAGPEVPAYLRNMSVDWLAMSRVASMNGGQVPMLPARALEELHSWLAEMGRQQSATARGGPALGPLAAAASDPEGAALPGGGVGAAAAAALAPAAGGAGAAAGAPADQERGGLHRMWQQLDRQWLQPWFGGRHTPHPNQRRPGRRA